MRKKIKNYNLPLETLEAIRDAEAGKTYPVRIGHIVEDILNARSSYY